MPVVSPADTSLCTYTVTKSSLAVIQRELKRASDLCQMIPSGEKHWKDLFEKHTFFTSDFRYYIAVISVSKDMESHKVWSGFVKSRVRMLVQELDQHSSIALARPFTEGYERTHLCKSPEEVEEVQHGALDYVVGRTQLDTVTGLAESLAAQVTDGESLHKKTDKDANEIKETNVPKAETTQVHTLTHYIGLELAEGTQDPGQLPSPMHPQVAAAIEILNWHRD